MASRNANFAALNMRLRPDLVVRRPQAARQGSWVVKDPVSLRYFMFTEQELAIVRWLDGTHSLDDLRREFEAAFPPLRITLQQLQGFLANLYENGLLIADGPDHGHLLLERGTRQRGRELWQEWSNILAFRFRGLDPDRVLTWLYPRLRWSFSPWFLAMCLLSVIASLLLIATHATDFRRQLPELHTLLQPSNLLWLMVAFAIAKVLHEFGHALTCKHFGGECHEMGIMLLLLTPTLYCNVTDAWLLRSRWQRIAVSAAGILVEIELAAVAVFLWWYSQPGVVHSIALNTIVVCSVGTLLFNGNPLLRYDGYFVLADLLEIPNLWQESRGALRQLLANWFLTPNAAAASDNFDRRGLLLSYGIASVTYRIFMTFAIFLFLYRALIPRGFGVLLPLVVASFVTAALVYWFNAVRRLWERPLAWRLFRPFRILATACLATFGLWGFLTIAWPCQITAPALLQPTVAHRVYVSTPGTLTQCAFPGESVAAGQVIARLEDAELDRDIERLRGEESVARTRVKNLDARLIAEPDVAAQLEIAREMLTDVQKQLAQRNRDAQALILQAPADGSVMEPPEVPSRPSDGQTLPHWTGTPLEQKNKQCFLERGALVCLVGDPTHQEAVVFVDETDIQYVRLGQHVRLLFPVAPTTVLSGRVEEISKRNILTVPRELAVEQELANRPDSSGAPAPVRTSYSIRVTLDEHDENLLAGASGRAKIEAEPQTLANRLLRALRRTLTVPM